MRRILDVLLLVGPHCPLCEHAASVLERVGRDAPLRVRTLSWDDGDARALRERDGVPFPPALYVDGAYWAYGRLSERWMRKRLARRRRAYAIPVAALALLMLAIGGCAYAGRRPRDGN